MRRHKTARTAAANELWIWTFGNAPSAGRLSGRVWWPCCWCCAVLLPWMRSACARAVFLARFFFFFFLNFFFDLLAGLVRSQCSSAFRLPWKSRKIQNQGGKRERKGLGVDAGCFSLSLALSWLCNAGSASALMESLWTTPYPHAPATIRCLGSLPSLSAATNRASCRRSYVYVHILEPSLLPPPPRFACLHHLQPAHAEALAHHPHTPSHLLHPMQPTTHATFLQHQRNPPLTITAHTRHQRDDACPRARAMVTPPT